MVISQVKYPVEWPARVICEATAIGCESEIKQILTSFALHPEIKRGASSKAGKYITFIFTVTLESREMMVELFGQISRINGVKFAL